MLLDRNSTYNSSESRLPRYLWRAQPASSTKGRRVKLAASPAFAIVGVAGGHRGHRDLQPGRQNGCVAERGTHAEPVSHDGPYRNFVETRSRIEGWRIAKWRGRGELYGPALRTWLTPLVRAVVFPVNLK